MDLDKIFDLFEQKHTAELSDRHAAAINQLCSDKLGGGSISDLEASKNGFYYKELPKVAQIVYHCFEGIKKSKVSVTTVNTFNSLFLSEP